MEYENSQEIDVNCNKLKLEFYKCLKSHDKKVGEEMRFIAKSKLKEIENYKVDKSVLKACNNKELVDCLNNKYRLKDFQEPQLFDYFSKQYDKVQERIVKEENKTFSKK